MSEEDKVKSQQRPPEFGTGRYSDTGLYRGARRVLEEQTRDWFAGLFADDVKRQMILLLLTIYIQFHDAVLITKKNAMERLKTADARTLHRYIQLAIDQDFITVRNSEADRRVDYLCPTKKLIETLDKEIESYLDEMQYHLEVQRQFGLPTLPPHFFYGLQSSEARVENLMINFGALDRPKIDLGELDRLKGEDVLGWQSRIVSYTETLRLFPEHRLAHLARGWAYAMVGEFDKALIDSHVQQKITPNEISAYFLAAEIYKKTDLIDNAIEQFSKFIEINPNSAHARKLRGHLLLLSGQLLESIKDFVMAVQLAQPHEIHAMTEEISRLLTLSIFSFSGNEKFGGARQLAIEALASLEKDPQSKDASERLSAFLDCLQSLAPNPLSEAAETGSDNHKKNG